MTMTCLNFQLESTVLGNAKTKRAFRILGDTVTKKRTILEPTTAKALIVSVSSKKSQQLSAVSLINMCNSAYVSYLRRRGWSWRTRKEACERAEDIPACWSSGKEDQHANIKMSYFKKKKRSRQRWRRRMQITNCCWALKQDKYQPWPEVETLRKE